MDLREILRLDRIQGGRGERPEGADPKKFQNLLDELQKITTERRSAGEEVTDLSEFADQLRRADEDYATLMDVRRKLEDAFRRRTP